MRNGMKHLIPFRETTSKGFFFLRGQTLQFAFQSASLETLAHRLPVPRLQRMERSRPGTSCSWPEALPVAQVMPLAGWEFAACA